MSKVSAYTSWQPLEEVIVGRAYTPDYFDFIENATVRDQLALILSETNEDLDALQKVCETYGAIVKRPGLIDKDYFQRLQTKDNGAPLPPLTPRDWQISLGDKLLRVLKIQELDEICAEYGDQVINPHGEQWKPDCVLNGASASCIVRVGTDVFFDNSDYLKPEQSRWIQENCLDSRYRFHEAITDGHGDAVRKEMALLHKPQENQGALFHGKQRTSPQKRSQLRTHVGVRWAAHRNCRFVCIPRSHCDARLGFHHAHHTAQIQA